MPIFRLFRKYYASPLPIYIYNHPLPAYLCSSWTHLLKKSTHFTPGYPGYQQPCGNIWLGAHSASENCRVALHGTYGALGHRTATAFPRLVQRIGERGVASTVPWIGFREKMCGKAIESHGHVTCFTRSHGLNPQIFTRSSWSIHETCVFARNALLLGEHGGTVWT